MKKFFFIFLSLFFITTSNAEDLKNKLTGKFTSNLNQYLTEFSTTLTAAHQGLENNVSGLNDITEELTEQIEKMLNRR